jgi:hypothetical protein
MITVASQVRVEVPATVKEGGFKGFFHLASPMLPGGRGNGANDFHHLFIITIFIGNQRKPSGRKLGPNKGRVNMTILFQRKRLGKGEQNHQRCKKAP